MWNYTSTISGVNPVKIDVGDLAKAVMDGLQEYSGAVADDIKAAAKKVADDCAKELRSTSPR